MRNLLWLLMPAWILLSFQATDFKVTGHVTDMNGQPLAQVTVSLKGAHKSVSTDAAGRYEIIDHHEKGTLIFSAVGYVTKQVQIKGQRVIDVSLTASLMEMQEVVVTAMGAEKDMTYIH